MPLLSPQRLAQTYDHPSKDPWEAVELYHEATKYPDDWGSQRVATKMGVGRGEIRAWVDGDGMPDSARAVEFAETHGWFYDKWNTTTEALARLTAITFACGSIANETYRPSWTPSDDSIRTQLLNDLDAVGTGTRFVSRDGTKPDEILSAEKASPLGRALVALGCTIGFKNERSTRSLPGFLEDAPLLVRVDWITTFVRERAISHPDKATLTIQTSRGGNYLESVARLIEDVTGESARASHERVTISADAVRSLGLA